MSNPHPGYPKGVDRILWLSRYRGAEIRRWTPEEIAIVAKGFIDLDLDGNALYRWCSQRGVDRSPGAIDAKLAELDFFDTDIERQRKLNARRGKAVMASKKTAIAVKMRERQVTMAKLEAEAMGEQKAPFRKNIRYMDMCKAEAEAAAAQRVALCDQQRRAEIARAKIEMRDGAPPLKSGKLEW